jgi:hypothetical protein
VSCERWIRVALVFEYNEYKSVGDRENEAAPGGGWYERYVLILNKLLNFINTQNYENAGFAIFTHIGHTLGFSLSLSKAQHVASAEQNCIPQTVASSQKMGHAERRDEALRILTRIAGWCVLKRWLW